jgi:hypothetical protein
MVNFKDLAAAGKDEPLSTFVAGNETLVFSGMEGIMLIVLFIYRHYLEMRCASLAKCASV